MNFFYLLSIGPKVNFGWHCFHLPIQPPPCMPFQNGISLLIVVSLTFIFNDVRQRPQPFLAMAMNQLANCCSSSEMNKSFASYSLNFYNLQQCSRNELQDLWNFSLTYFMLISSSQATMAARHFFNHLFIPPLLSLIIKCGSKSRQFFGFIMRSPNVNVYSKEEDDAINLVGRKWPYYIRIILKLIKVIFNAFVKFRIWKYMK